MRNNIMERQTVNLNVALLNNPSFIENIKYLTSIKLDFKKSFRINPFMMDLDRVNIMFNNSLEKLYLKYGDDIDGKIELNPDNYTLFEDEYNDLVKDSVELVHPKLSFLDIIESSDRINISKLLLFTPWAFDLPTLSELNIQETRSASIKNTRLATQPIQNALIRLINEEINSDLVKKLLGVLVAIDEVIIKYNKSNIDILEKYGKYDTEDATKVIIYGADEGLSEEEIKVNDISLNKELTELNESSTNFQIPIITLDDISNAIPTVAIGEIAGLEWIFDDIE